MTADADDVAPDQFYTGLVADAYAPLRGSPPPAAPYESFVRRWGEPALEIGCGHGEPLLDLVAAGLDVWGLDSSADMLALCLATAERRGLSVTLIHQRMEDLAIDQGFASIYLAGPTFQLVLDLSAALGALQRMAASLLPGGRLMVPLFTPVPVEERHLGMWREHVTDSGETLAFQAVAQSYRSEERRVDSTLRYRRGPVDAPVEIIERTWSLRWYEGDEFEVMAAAAGLSVDRVLDHGSAGRSYVLKRDEPERDGRG